jgi:hypothetical protein
MKFNIFKREKPKSSMPEPMFEDNWKQDQYEKNVKRGVDSLKEGKTINIMDDGRGYELALDIKRQFILEYQKQLSEQIKIEGSGNITIKRIV